MKQKITSNKSLLKWGTFSVKLDTYNLGSYFSGVAKVN